MVFYNILQSLFSHHLILWTTSMNKRNPWMGERKACYGRSKLSIHPRVSILQTAIDSAGPVERFCCQVISSYHHRGSDPPTPHWVVSKLPHKGLWCRLRNSGYYPPVTGFTEWLRCSLVAWHATYWWEALFHATDMHGWWNVPSATLLQLLHPSLRSLLRCNGPIGVALSWALSCNEYCYSVLLLNSPSWLFFVECIY